MLRAGKDGGDDVSRLYCRPMIAEGTYAVYVLEYSHTRHEHHRTCQHAAMTSLFMGSLQFSHATKYSEEPFRRTPRCMRAVAKLQMVVYIGAS